MGLLDMRGECGYGCGCGCECWVVRGEAGSRGCW